MVGSAEGVAELADHLRGQPVIAFDTEFLREKTFFPQLGLLQIADREKSWLVDPLAIPSEAMRPLAEVFTSPDVLKVAHAAEQDQECLFHDYGVLAAPLLDTSTAAALCGWGDQVGLTVVLRKSVGVVLPKMHTRADWLRRPLSEAMIEYAALDVAYLVEASDRLLAELDRRGRRAWALELSARLSDPSRFEAHGEEVAKRLAAGSRLTPREYAVLKELVKWRELRVRAADIPRRWIAEDRTLIQLARAQPADPAALSDFRGLNGNKKERGVREILDSIRCGLEVVDEELEEPPRKLEATADEGPALTAFRCFLNALARDAEIPLRYLIESDTALLLLRREFNCADELRDCGLIDEAAWKLFGDEIYAILKGKRALRLKNGRAIRFDID